MEPGGPLGVYPLNLDDCDDLGNGVCGILISGTSELAALTGSDVVDGGSPFDVTEGYNTQPGGHESCPRCADILGYSVADGSSAWVK